MPRASAENRAASAWREGGQHPPPPKHLSADAKRIWKDIVGVRPVDFFAPGSLHLLEQFCESVVQQRIYAEMMRADPLNEEAVAHFTKLGALLNATAAKLRLSIQSALRTESRKNEEREPQAAAPQLLGAGVVRLDRSGRKAS
jgi:hypothetical protein